MPKFSTGQNKEGIRSAQWLSTSYGFEGHVVRIAIGTADAAEYPHAAADLPWGVLDTDGTLNNYIDVVTGGVPNMRNSLNGTINLGDPVILDYTNSNGTTGFVKSAYTTETLAMTAPLDEVIDTGTRYQPASYGLSNKAVPGSIRVMYGGGNGVPAVLEQSGTVIVADGTHGFGTITIAYNIDQPILGFAREQATTPRQLFKVEIAKQNYYKNNTVN